MYFLWDGLGTTGIVLCLLPTKPLVLPAAWRYCRSSPHQLTTSECRLLALQIGSRCVHRFRYAITLPMETPTNCSSSSRSRSTSRAKSWAPVMTPSTAGEYGAPVDDVPGGPEGRVCPRWRDDER
jgi:hypothetical protein